MTLRRAIVAIGGSVVDTAQPPASARTPAPLPETLTVEEVATILRISVQSVRRLLRDKELPGVRVGKYWRVPRVALEAFLDGHKAA